MKFIKNLPFVVLFPLIVLCTDLIIRWNVLTQFNDRMLSYYALSVFSSFIFYFSIFLIFNQLSRFLSRASSIFIAFIFSFFYSFSLVGSYGYFFTANMLPNYFVIHYMIQEPMNSFTLVKDSFSLYSGLIWIFLFIFSFMGFHKFSQIDLPFRRVGKIVTFLLGIFSLSLFGLISFNTRFQDQLYVSDVNSIAFVSRNIINRILPSKMGTTGLQSRTKISIKETFPKPKFNILLVVAESLRKDHIGIYNYPRDTTPFLKSLVSKKEKELFLFQNAHSNASSTLISFPSILTGVSPIQPAADTHSYPIFWEYGKKAGMNTFYITSHSLAWNNLNGYLSNSGIDYLYDKETSGESIYNDIGIDDRKTLATFDTHIKQLAHEKKTFAGVLHLNTNHFPFFVPGTSKIWKDNDIKDLYDNSVYHFDKLIEKMFVSLTEAGQLDNTIILMTSDHGESLLEHNYMGHIESYYLEVVSIPMMIYIPKSFQKEEQVRNLNLNSQKNVMNLDLIPTIINLLGNTEDNSNKTVKLSGSSLLSNVSPNRTIVISNNNETSIYKVGISYIQNDLHYILKINSVPKKEELYNIKSDPFELHNLWSEQSEENKEKIRRVMNGCTVCSELFSQR